MINVDRPTRIFYIIATSTTPIPSTIISKEVNASVRTVKQDMENVRLIAQKSGTRLISKRGLGYSIEVLDPDIFSKVMYQLQIRASYAIGYLDHEQSTEYYDIMQYMISQDGYFKIEEIEELFYIPRKSLSHVLQYFRTFIKNYNLRLESKPNYGNIIKGSEFNLRLAMVELFDVHFHGFEVKHTIGSFLKYFEESKEELSVYRQALLKVLRTYHYQIHDDFTQRLSRHLVLQHKRNQAGFTTFVDSNLRLYVCAFSLQMKIAAEILKDLSDQLGNKYTEEDTIALCMLILLWTDSPIYLNYQTVFDPILDDVDSIYHSYIQQTHQSTGIDLDAIESFDSFLKSQIAPLLIYDSFSANQFDYLIAGFMDRDFTNPVGQILATQLLKHFKSTPKISYSNYLIEKLVEAFSLFVYRTEVKTSVNILISSAKGMEGALNIEKFIRDTLHPSLIGNLLSTELYEGRGIALSDYDLFILDRYSSVYYTYDWPCLCIDFSRFNISSRAIFNRIHEMSRQLKHFKLEGFVREHQKIHHGLLNRKVNYIFDASLPPNTFQVMNRSLVCFHFNKPKDMTLYDLNLSFERALAKYKTKE